MNPQETPSSSIEDQAWTHTLTNLMAHVDDDQALVEFFTTYEATTQQQYTAIPEALRTNQRYESIVREILTRLRHAIRQDPARTVTDLDFSSSEDFNESLRKLTKRLSVKSINELLDAFQSNSESEQDLAFQSLKAQLEDDELQHQAIDYLLVLFRSYLEQRSIAAMQAYTRATFSAEDIIQLVTLKLTRRLRDRKVELRSVGQFKVYLRTMTQRIAMDQLRTKPGPAGGGHGLEDADDATVLISNDPAASMLVRTDELEQAVKDKLSPDEWDLFRMRVIEEHDWLHIASQCYPEDSPEQRKRRMDALRMHLSRLLKKLSQELAGFQSLCEAPEQDQN